MASLTYPDAHVHGCDDLGELVPGSFVNAAGETEWQTCLNTAEAMNCRAFLGIHPWYLDDAGHGWQNRLRKLAEDHPIGVGEIGLDKFKGPSLDDQLQSFNFQFDLAMEFRRPVSIHCVKRWGALMDALARHAPFSANVMVHGYCGSLDVQKELLGLGCYLSFGFQLIDKSENAVNAWISTPEDRILLESDAPSSLEKRGLTAADYGAEASRVLSVASGLRGVSSGTLADVLRRNASDFLGK